MNKIAKPIIVSSLSALAFGAIGVAGTFALFTDKAQTTIEADAGVVDVSAALSGIRTYSAKADPNGTLIDEYQEKYVHELQETEDVQGVTHYLFVNGGYVTYEANAQTGNGSLTLKKMTPGDKVEFAYDLNNGSTVDFLYRFRYEVLNDNYDLSKGLVTTIKRGQAEAESYTGLELYRTAWELHQIGDELGTVNFTIELPIDEGNEYQAKTADIVIDFEAVQGNAAVSDELYIVTTEAETQGQTFAPVVEEAVENQDLVLEATSRSKDVSVKVTIPAATQEVEAGNEVSLIVSDAQVTTASDNVSVLNFDIGLTVNGQSVSSYSETIPVEVNIGTGYHIGSVKHKNIELLPAGTSADPIPEGHFTYDPAEGIVRFNTNSFSPFTVEYYENVVAVQTYQEFKEACADPYTTVKLLNDIEIPFKTVRSGMAGAREVFEPETCEVARNVVIDGNGHKLSLPPFYVDDSTLNAIMTINGAAFKLMGDNVTLNNLTLDCSHLLNQKALINANFMDNLQIVDCTFFGDLDYIGAGQLFKNVTKDTLLLRCNVYDMMGCFYESDGNVLDGTVTIKDSTINTCNYTANFGEGTENSALVVDNCTFRGWTSFGGLHSTQFSDTTFKKTVYSSTAAGSYNYGRFYSDVTFTNCVFDHDYSADIVNEATATYVGCSFLDGNGNPVALTPASYDPSKLAITSYTNDLDGLLGKQIIIGETVVASGKSIASATFPELPEGFEDLLHVDDKTSYLYRETKLGEDLYKLNIGCASYPSKTDAGTAATQYESDLVEAGFTAMSNEDAFLAPNGEYKVSLSYGGNGSYGYIAIRVTVL